MDPSRQGEMVVYMYVGWVSQRTSNLREALLYVRGILYRDDDQRDARVLYSRLGIGIVCSVCDCPRARARFHTICVRMDDSRRLDWALRLGGPLMRSWGNPDR